MKKLTILLVLATTALFAQETITKKLGDFNTLKVFNGLRVSLEQGKTNKVIISGKKSNNVVIKNVKGKLKITLNITGVFKPQDVDIIKLIYAKEITVLDANEGAIVTSKELIKQGLLEVRVQEGAIINLDVAVKSLTAKAVTGGNLELSGNVINQFVEVASGGHFEGKELLTENTTVKATTGGEASVFAIMTLNAKATLSGQIYYYGNPKDVQEKITLAGFIKKNG